MLAARVRKASDGVGVTDSISASLLGGWLGTSLPGGTTTGLDVRSLIMAITGSLLLLLFSYRCYAIRAVA